MEYGIEARKGVSASLRRLAEVLEDAENELPFEGRALLRELGDELRRLNERVKAFDPQIASLFQRSPTAQRLTAIPGIGPITATAPVAAVGDASAFKDGRELSAWLGLTPRQLSTGGRPRLLGISKRGDRCLRCLLIHGARAALRQAGRHGDRRSCWVAGGVVDIEARRGKNVAAVALANKNARAAWALLTKATDFDRNHLAKAA